MMGGQTRPERLFYDFCLEEHVPAGHLLRQIDGVLDLDELRDQLKPFYSCPCRKPDPLTNEAESDDAAARWGISAGCSGAPWSGYFGRVLRWKSKSFCFDTSSMFCDENLPSEWPLLALTAWCLPGCIIWPRECSML